MAKIIRVPSIRFGSTAPSQTVEEFGSKTLLGSPTYTTDPNQIQQLSTWTDGWTAAVAPGNKAPYVQDMNAFCLVDSYQISYLLQQGIPEWDASTVYYKGSYVQDPAGSGQLWFSLQDANVGNTPVLGASNAFWQYENGPQVPPGSSLDFMGIVIPQGFFAEDGTAYSRVTYSTLFNVLNLSMVGNMTVGQPQVMGLSNTASLQLGWFVSGPGVATGSSILSIDSPSQVTLTLPATGTASGTYVFGPWGVGDGSTSFNVPDTRRRVSVGAGGAGSTVLGSQLGAVGGEEAHILTIPEMPAHTHLYSGGFPGATGGSGAIQQFTNVVTTSSTGGSGAHNNVQPSYVVTKIIKF